MTDAITGTLTDYDLMTEGQFEGYYGARIDDKPYVVMHHVDSFLLRLAKGESVEALLNKDGHISKIQRRKLTPAARQHAETTRPKEEIDKEQQDYNAKAKSYGFGEPTPGSAKTEAQKNIDKANAEGDRRIAENVQYLKELVAGKNQETCTSPEKPAAIIPVQQSHPITTMPAAFNEKIDLIKAKIAPDCTDTEFELLMYMANKYNLDPLVHQIWAVKFVNKPALIFAGRDGFLEIAHRSGVFDGMEAGTKMDGDEIVGWCKVYRKDMSHPFYVEVYLKEYEKPVGYSGKPGNWQTMPRVMIQKVAESSCLRRAFSVSGLYAPEEINTEQGGA